MTVLLLHLCHLIGNYFTHIIYGILPTNALNGIGSTLCNFVLYLNLLALGNVFFHWLETSTVTVIIEKMVILYIEFNEESS